MSPASPTPAVPQPTDRAREVVAFASFGVRQLMYAFMRLEHLAGQEPAGTIRMQFYTNAAYNLISVMFLLDRGGRARGGTLHRVLSEIGHADVLDPCFAVLDRPLGTTTVGELIRRFRNEALVHGNLSASDVWPVLQQANLHDPALEKEFYLRLHVLWVALPVMMLALCRATGVPSDDVGMGEFVQR